MLSLQYRLHWTFRITAALCFIGHGAWGFMAKPGWVPFFTSVGFSEEWALRLMPFVGLHDVLLAAVVLLKPNRPVLVWMTLWCVWTACLRPISGMTMWEVWERAGNFGVPFAFLMLWPGLTENRLPRLEFVLRFFLAMLLFGHAGFGVFVQKPMLLEHYASIGLPSSQALNIGVGLFEFFLAAAVLIKPPLWPQLLWFILLWKLGTEFLYVTTGPTANIFEWIERWGDYGLPFALLAIHQYRSRYVAARLSLQPIHS
jgi:hypothetical protein